MPRTLKQNIKTTEISPLIVLRKIRDVMASPQSAQLRLDALVRVIAEELRADVCSVYLLRAGDVLELFASQGLKQASVHLTRLQLGEGLVGEIAASGATLNLADAKTHPKFVYKPETGEENFHSFVGIPIMQAGRVVGVLVVQSKEAKIFTEDQIEVLQTVSMVLAELNDSGKLVSLSEISQASGNALVSMQLNGLKFAPGLARAAAVIHSKHIEVKMALSEDPAHEVGRMEHALTDFQASIDRLIVTSNLKEGDEQFDIMETYRMFAHDKGWLNQITEAIHSGLTAEAAVKHVQDQLHLRMSQVSSEYIKERMQDLEDVSGRLLEHLSGKTSHAHSELPEEFILIAKSLGPAEFLEYGRRKIKGLVLEDGSATSHIVVIARALEIPVVGRVSGALAHVRAGDPVVVDGDSGDVYIRPSESVEQSIAEHMEQRRQQQEVYEAMRPAAPVTTDGVSVSLGVNAGIFLDIKHLSDAGVEGIGLYRTELPYMISTSMPDVASQSKIYGKIIRQAAGKRVIFRTFDIGGDKQLPYFPIDDEENPAMGWRATRIGLDRPAILRRQLRALIQSAAGNALDIMFPFITQAREIDECRKLLTMELVRAKQEGFTPPSPIRIGAMIEVPSLLWQLPALMKRLDFVSIGSNDLLQFFFACDRGSMHVGERYDVLAPEVLRMLRHVAEEGRKHQVEVSFCGEMARKPLEAMALIGAGIHRLSVPTSALGPIKAMIRSLNGKEIVNYVSSLCEHDEPSLRRKLEDFARDHGVRIDL